MAVEIPPDPAERRPGRSLNPDRHRLHFGAAVGGYDEPPPRLEVRGTVTETGSNQPIAEATVRVYLVADPPPKIIINGGPQDLIAATETGIDGGFSAEVPRFGTVRIRVEKDGFRGAAMFRPVIDETTVALDAAHPRRELKLQLGRPGGIAGRVVDEETRKPLDHVKVAAYMADYRGGSRRFLAAGGPVESGGDGQFVVASRPPNT